MPSDIEEVTLSVTDVSGAKIEETALPGVEEVFELPISSLSDSSVDSDELPHTSIVAESPLSINVSQQPMILNREENMYYSYGSSRSEPSDSDSKDLSADDVYSHASSNREESLMFRDRRSRNVSTGLNYKKISYNYVRCFKV